MTSIENDDLKIQSDNWIYSSIPKEYHEQIIFEGSYNGIQCGTEIETLQDFNNYKEFRCTCYELRTKQNQVLYLGSDTWAFRQAQVCFDLEKKIVKTPKKEHILAVVKHLNNKYIPLDEIKTLTKDKVQGKTKFGEFPMLTYNVNEDKVLWKGIRYNGRQNATLYEFKIDAINGDIIEIKKLPYRITFWQWLSGMKY